MPKGEVRFKVTAKGTQVTKKKVKQVQKAFEDLRKESATELESTFNMATRALSGFIRVVSAFGRAVNLVAQRGAAFGGPASTFARMADPSMLRRLEQLSAWQIRQVDLMRTYNQVMQVQLVNQEEFAEWTERITAAAMSRGEAPAEMFQRMSEVLSGGGFEALRTMGVNIAEIQEAVQASGESMESLAGKSMALDMALEQLREIQGDVTNNVSNLADAFSAATNDAQNYFDQVSQIVSESPELTAGIESARQTLSAFGATAQTTGGLLEVMFTAILRGLTHVVQWSAWIVDLAFERLQIQIAGIRENPAFQWLVENLPGGQQLEEMMNNLVDLAGGARTVAGAWEQGAIGARLAMEGAAAQETPEVRPTGPPRRPRAQPDEGGGDTPENEARRWQELKRLQEEYTQSQWQAEQDILDARQEWNESQQQQLREQHAEQMEFIEERARLEIESQEAIAEAQDRRFEKHVGQITSMASGFASLGTTISQIIAQNAENTEKARKVEGAFMIAYNSVMAATELAEAIRSFAKQRYGSGALHLVAMAKYIAAAALAGSRLGGGSASASTGGTYRPVDNEVSKPDDDKDKGYTIYQNYSLSRSEAELGQVMERAQYRREETGLYSGRVEGIHFGS